MHGEQFVDDVRTVALEALRKLERCDEHSKQTAVAAAIGDTIPNDRGPETYKADLMVRATDVLERATD